jgi:hypothetical protein
MAAIMSGFKDGRQVIVPVLLEFTGLATVNCRVLPRVEEFASQITSSVIINI